MNWPAGRITFFNLNNILKSCTKNTGGLTYEVKPNTFLPLKLLWPHSLELVMLCRLASPGKLHIQWEIIFPILITVTACRWKIFTDNLGRPGSSIILYVSSNSLLLRFFCFYQIYAFRNYTNLHMFSFWKFCFLFFSILHIILKKFYHLWHLSVLKKEVCWQKLFAADLIANINTY